VPHSSTGNNLLPSQSRAGSHRHRARGGGAHQPAGPPLRLKEQEAAVRSALHDRLRSLDASPPTRQGWCSWLSGCRLEYCPCPYSDIYCLLLAQQITLPPLSPSRTYHLSLFYFIVLLRLLLLIRFSVLNFPFDCMRWDKSESLAI
jgi:hypothetical protein